MPVASWVEGHPRRCKGRSRVTGERCRCWASKNANYCKFHGGRRKVYSNKNYKGVKHLRYSKYLGKTLREHVEAAAGARESLIELRDELGLMRALAGKAIGMYEIASQRPVEEYSSPQEKAACTARASELLVNCLNQVRDMALAAHRIEQRDSLGSDSLNAIIIQMTNAIDYKMRDIEDPLRDAGIDPEKLVNSIADYFKSEMKIHKGQLEAVESTPQELVDEMDKMQ